MGLCAPRVVRLWVGEARGSVAWVMSGSAGEVGVTLGRAAG